MEIESRLMSIPEVAAALGVSRFTVRSWLRQRRLGYYRLGRRIVIAAAEIDRFLTANRVSARDVPAR